MGKGNFLARREPGRRGGATRETNTSTATNGETEEATTPRIIAPITANAFKVRLATPMRAKPDALAQARKAVTRGGLAWARSWPPCTQR
jgi:hypothetical protein